MEHFRLLAEADEGLKRWFRLARRKPKTPAAVDVTSAEAISRLWGVNRRDIDRSVIAELGWTLSLWNGEMNGLSASTSLHCGSTLARVSNCAYLSVSGESTRSIDNVIAIDLLKQIVELWDADKGIAYHYTSVEEQIKIAAYEKRRWPMFKPRNAVRHAQGYIRLAR
jgi:hypothetical protein